MQLVYLVTLIITVLAPVLFHRLLPKFKKDVVPLSVFVGISIVAIYKIAWDILFTQWGIWGFDNRFTLPYRVAGLPIEEYLFFFLVPYASMHLYIVVEKHKLPVLSERIAEIITALIFVASLIGVVLFYSQLYTLFIFCTTIILLTVLFLIKYDKLRFFYTAFLLILAPFILVNGVLTGMFNPYGAPVVWYNNSQILGVRVGSIPIEDFFYAYVMLLGATTIYVKRDLQ